MGNSTARDKSRIQSEPESEGGATIEAPPASDVGITCIAFNGFQKFITASYNAQAQCCAPEIGGRFYAKPLLLLLKNRT